MAYRAMISGVEQTISVEDGETLLSAALGAGIAYPHGCRSGRCGSCKTQLLDGQVDLLPHTPFSLTEAEKQQGLILACRARPSSDVAVRWLARPAASHPVVRTTAVVRAVEPLTHDIVEIRLKPEQPLAASPGQFARLYFRGLPARDYSFAPTADGEVAFHVRVIAGGEVSPAIAGRTRPGLRVTIEGPYGEAYLREDHTGPMLCVAGGSGLAPILSIVNRAVSARMHQPIHMYFGARDTGDIYGVEQLSRLAAKHPRLTMHIVLSATRAPGPHRSGFVHQAIAGDLSGSKRGWKAYVAGPPAMVDAVDALCREHGMKPGDFHADPFFTPSALSASLGSEHEFTR
ncbi:2Fe-2S iron-sulfur cluster-binding protein [Mesorhizobium sp. B2-6-2]|uniref:2Fe-2S iron-sulfur cluster-binding protein n=1 Tax=Mesorhizobium sp. B2-6-2 TaxID=2589915 RepID=UPI00112E3BA0|nr:2Fe-2S iron-sulfur cluster-binding protein [Mesorhizobium sp. B2-6-2]TPJ77152.1 2Fe-2S iron-sulfur cluster binding domain-containing protein [Mesorhizobium sp. B2-6-2]